MKNEPNKPTFRTSKVSALIQKIVGASIIPILDHEKGLVTVSKVEVSRDMKWTKVFISIFNGNDDRILKLLHDNIYEIQGDLNRKLAVKIVPRVQFTLDESPRYAQHIDEVIKKIHEE